MIRTWLFLAIESLLLSGACLCAWILLMHALKKLGARVPGTSRLALLPLWLLFFLIDVAATRKYGAPFTALYQFAAFALAVGIAVYIVGTVLRLMGRGTAREGITGRDEE